MRAQPVGRVSVGWLSRPSCGGIFTSNSLGRYKYQGWGGYAHLPVRITKRLVVRAAGRFIAASRTSGRSPWAFSSQGDSWALNEQFLALGWNSPTVGAEASLARSATSDDAAILGGGRGSAGRRHMGRDASGRFPSKERRRRQLASSPPCLRQAYPTHRPRGWSAGHPRRSRQQRQWQPRRGHAVGIRSRFSPRAFSGVSAGLSTSPALRSCPSTARPRMAEP